MLPRDSAAPTSMWVKAALLMCLALQRLGVAVPQQAPAAASIDTYTRFEQPGTMVRLPAGNRLSLYCEGHGAPVVVLEAGFGGGAYQAWHLLQHSIARTTRVCSYDRAGYGFSELGSDLPRDVKHDVADLHAMLHASGLSQPYLLVGHSDGGHILGAFSDLYPEETAALVFLDAAVLLSKPAADKNQAPSPALKKYFDSQLAQVRTCLARAEQAHGRLTPAPKDPCLDTEDLAKLPPKMANAVTASESRPEDWKALPSESEQHYLVSDDHWEEDLLPHHWQHMPIRVFIASVASLTMSTPQPVTVCHRKITRRSPQRDRVEPNGNTCRPASVTCLTTARSHACRPPSTKCRTRLRRP